MMSQPTPGQQFKLSCKSCRHRKVKCDRVYPCGPCQKSGHDCMFPQPMRRPGAKSRNAELTQRLARLENLMGSLGSDATIPDKPTPALSPNNSESGSSNLLQDVDKLRLRDQEPLLRSDGSRYLSSDFFANLSGEVDGLRQLLNEVSDEEDETGRSSSISHPSQYGEIAEPSRMLLFPSSNRSDLRPLHPSPSHMSVYGALYFTRVDPKFKILHRQTTLSLILYVSRNPGSYTQGQEALLFAVYYAVIASLNEVDCVSRFGEPRDVLFSRYKHALETSMIQANILETHEMAALQALVLYLVCSRVDNGSSRSPWTLFATAVRIAQAMEVDRDGSTLGLSAFETEMRRRVWWSIIVLDVFYAEARGTSPIIRPDTFDTLPPLNIPDDQLSDVSGVLGEEVAGGTEMTFSRISQDASLFIIRFFALNPRSRTIQEETITTFAAKEKLASELANLMYTKWLANCDKNPSYWDCVSLSKILICRSFLSLHRPVQSLRPQTLKVVSRQYILATAVSSLELVQITASPAAEAFRWYTIGYVPWQQLAIILAELCVQTHGWLVDRAWALVHDVFLPISERVADSKTGALFRPIRKLFSKARQVRLSHSVQAIMPATSDPEWIGLYPMPWSQIANTPDYGDLHDATISMVIGQPQKLDTMLAMTATLPQIEPTTFDFNTTIQPSFSPEFMDDTMGTIDWEDWDSLVQTSLNFEQPLPEADKSYFPMT